MPYEICIYRTGRTSGTLTYEGVGVKGVVTDCYFHPHNHIPPRTYQGCSATHMGRAYGPDGKPKRDTKWQAILIPNVPGYDGIFVHWGEDATWSNACICIKYPVLLRIWRDIPLDRKNVTVTVKDGPYLPAKPPAPAAGG